MDLLACRETLLHSPKLMQTSSNGLHAGLKTVVYEQPGSATAESAFTKYRCGAQVSD
jgi:hypothetical protein